MTDCDCTYTAADIDTLVNDLQVSWAEVAELKRKLAKAVKDLKGWLEVSQHCTIEDGVCWCGEDMKNHRNSTNYAHSPVDHGAYVARRLAESTRATLAEIEVDKR